MSTTETTASLRTLALGDLEQELQSTRRVLERLPDEQLGWKPHEKSFSLGGLATHLATLPVWLVSIVREDSFDLGVPRPKRDPLESREALLAEFDRNAAALLEALEGADDALLSRRWELRVGEAVLMAAPKHAVLRRVGISHIVHHRGQMTVYLRVLEVPVPAIYGPSADEQGGM